MKRSLRAAFSAGLAAALPAAGGTELVCGADAPLASPVRLEYAVTATRAPISLSGQGAVVFQRQGDAYTIESTLQAVGLFEAQQTSSGSVRRDGLVPRSFTQRSSRRPPLSVDFDWSAQRVTFSQTGASAPTRPQMQDRLSLLLQLGWRHRHDADTRRLELAVAGHRSTSSYVFSEQATETLTLPAGRFETVRFERHKKDGEDSLQVWLAPSLCSLPVRLRFTDDKGLVIEQRLSAVRPM